MRVQSLASAGPIVGMESDEKARARRCKRPIAFTAKATLYFAAPREVRTPLDGSAGAGC